MATKDHDADVVLGGFDGHGIGEDGFIGAHVQLCAEEEELCRGVFIVEEAPG